MQKNRLLKNLLISLSVVFSFHSMAQSNLHHYVLKLSSGDSLSRFDSSVKIKHLFNNVYRISSPQEIKQDEASLFGSSKLILQSHGQSKSFNLPKLRGESVWGGSSPDTKNDFFNDPYAGKLWAFTHPLGMHVNHAYEFIPFAPRENVVVAVVDTGVDYNHEDLKDIMWKNSGEIAGNGIDDDNNGYVDDIYGINTLVRDANGDATTEPMASHWHGSHVSGTIAATQNNSMGIMGVSNSARIMAIRTVPDNSDETDLDIIEAFLYAAKNGAKIINCSFGKKLNEGGDIVKEAMDFIQLKYDVLVVAAAGNDYRRNIDTRLVYPASFESENLLVVAASNRSESGVPLTSFSNVGKKNVDVAAPGSSIFSTTKDNRYGSADGTSMASPNTAGVAAMIRAYYPELSAVEVKEIIMKSVTPIESFKGLMQSPGIVNLHQAMELAKTY